MRIIIEKIAHDCLSIKLILALMHEYIPFTERKQVITLCCISKFVKLGLNDQNLCYITIYKACHEPFLSSMKHLSMFVWPCGCGFATHK